MNERREWKEIHKKTKGEERDVQNTEAQLEATALMDVQNCPTHRCTNRAWNNALLEREQ